MEDNTEETPEGEDNDQKQVSEPQQNKVQDKQENIKNPEESKGDQEGKDREKDLEKDGEEDSEKSYEREKSVEEINEEEQVEEDTYQVLEETYRIIRPQIDATEGMENFSREYTRLFEAYFKSYSHEQEQNEATEILVEHVEAYKDALGKAEETESAHQETIAKLTEELEYAKKLVDSAHARELNSQEVIEKQRQQIKRSKIELEKAQRLIFDSEEPDSSKKEREKLMKENERLQREIQVTKERLDTAGNTLEQMERAHVKVEKRIEELRTKLSTQENEMNKQIKLKERFEHQVKDLTNEIDLKKADLDAINSEFTEVQINNTKMQATMKQLKAENETLEINVSNLNNRLAKMQLYVEHQTQLADKLTLINKEKSRELKVAQDDRSRLRTELSRSDRAKETYFKELTVAQTLKTALENEKLKLKDVIKQQEKDLETAKKQSDSDKIRIEDLLKAKDVLSKNVLKAAAAAYEQQRVLKLQEQIKKNLQIEIDNFTLDSKRLKKNIKDLEKERDKYVLETQELTQKIQETLDEIKLKEVLIFDCKKKLTEAETKFRMQQNLFEIVRGERNALSKSLQEAQDDISDLKHRLKVMGHQTEQLKEDCTTKENLLVKREAEIEKLEKEKEALKVEMKKVRNELQDSKQQIMSLNTEMRKLHKTIQEADDEIQKQKKEMEQIMNERDILGTQLVKRTDEISLLNEKVDLLQNTLHKGETQYDQRLKDIQLLKLEVNRLRHEKELLSKGINNMTDMRQEIVHLERDLTREKLKCRALEDELQSPVNIHRWRKLEGADPNTYELIQKNQRLEQRLLQQAREAKKQDAKLQEVERLNQNLKDLLSSQPGPEAAERLQKTQMALKDKDRKMKCLIAEHNMFKAQVSEYKSNLDITKNELNSVKKKYFAQKRRQEKAIESEQAIKTALPPIKDEGAPCFAGGGFNLNAGPKICGRINCKYPSYSLAFLCCTFCS